MNNRPAITGIASWTEEQFEAHVRQYVDELLRVNLPDGVLDILGSGTRDAGRNKVCYVLNVRGSDHIIRNTLILENGSTIHANDVSGEVFAPPGVSIAEQSGKLISLKVTNLSWKDIAHRLQIA